MSTFRTRPDAGYSLVELLIVLALFALISIAIAGGMRFGARVWERTEREVSAAESARGGHALLTTLLSHIYPRRRTNDSAVEPAFEGAAGRMTFLADAPAPFAAPGISRFTLSVERVEAAVRLTLAQHVEQGPRIERTEVLMDAQAITFSYAEIIDGALRWTDTWQGREAMPILLRIRVSLPNRPGVWPDLLVRPRIDRAANCIYDPVSFGCRNG